MKQSMAPKSAVTPVTLSRLDRQEAYQEDKPQKKPILFAKSLEKV